MLSDSLLLLSDSEPEGLVALGSQILLWLRVAIGIGVVIFVHELGHFVAAKMFGVKCEKFYVGFDPPLKFGPIRLPSSLIKFRYGETEYGIGVVPLGGYVKMLGQDDDPRRMQEAAALAKQVESEDEEGSELDDAQPTEEQIANAPLDPRSLPAKPVWQRMIIMSAGVFMNIVTAAMFAALAFMNGVDYTPAIIGGTSPGSPAWQSGIEIGGEVVAVDGLQDNQLHFREMQSAILHTGLEDPDRRIPLSLRYGDDVKDFNLATEPISSKIKRRVIGVKPIDVPKISKYVPPLAGTAFAAAATKDDMGSAILSYNGNALDQEDIKGAVPLLDYLFTHPDEPIQLVLKSDDEGATEKTITLQPQASKWLGIRLSVGPVTALMKDGPAEAAGLKVDDAIQALNGTPVSDGEQLIADLAKREPITLSVKRGDQTVQIEITPNDRPQVEAPTYGNGDAAAINAYGFAFSLPAVVQAFDEAAVDSGDALLPGDQIIQLVPAGDNEYGKLMDDEITERMVKLLAEGWKIDELHSAFSFFESIQFLPEGTRFEVMAKRDTADQKDVIVKTVLKLTQDDRNRFDRGLYLEPLTRTQYSTSLANATLLGMRETKRRASDVGRFLRMLVFGKVSADQVGGPIKIFDFAGSAAERGFSEQLLFLTMLSVNLAILNFLPIPVLDGGHMVFLTCEAVMGRRVDEQMEMRLTMVGGLMLLSLFIFVMFNDIIGLFAN